MWIVVTFQINCVKSTLAFQFFCYLSSIYISNHLVKILYKGVDPNSKWITGDLLDVKRVNLYLSILKDWKGRKMF